MIRFGALAAVLLTAACSDRSPAEGEAPQSMFGEPPAGEYRLDRAHSSVLFRVDHLGFSNWTARFTAFDATLKIDPEKPEEAELAATVEAASLETDYPDPATLDFNEIIEGPAWLAAKTHPEITFRSTDIELTGPDTAKITGDFTLRGVTKPLVLETRFNGGYAGFANLDPARIGFSATGAIKRSEFGMVESLPTEELPLGAGDRVEIVIEAELSGPPPEAVNGE